MSTYEKQMEKIRSSNGFIAALDQSGGSTPKALRLYGVNEDAYTNDHEMFDMVHAMRTRIMTSASFTGERILGAILFENTMDRSVEDRDTADYLWKVKHVVPFLKVDKGLEDVTDGAQVMKPMPELDALLTKAKGKGIFGTKMRSVIKEANAKGIGAVVDQQFAVGRQICAAGLVPIIEPEVDIHCADKKGAEALLEAAILEHLNRLSDDENVMLKLTLPEETDLYLNLINHPRVVRVVALSGGYSREEANRRLMANKGMIASFSRALSEGLNAGQSQAQFDAMMDDSIESIFQASKT